MAFLRESRARDATGCSLASEVHVRDEVGPTTPRELDRNVMYGGSAAIGYPPVICFVLTVDNVCQCRLNHSSFQLDGFQAMALNPVLWNDKEANLT